MSITPTQNYSEQTRVIDTILCAEIDRGRSNRKIQIDGIWELMRSYNDVGVGMSLLGMSAG